MDRMEQLASLAAETMRKNLIITANDIATALKGNDQQIIDSVVNAVQMALHEAVRWQKNGSKGPISYISFSFLQSNLLLNHYALRVDAWDERFMIDDMESAAEWDFHTIFPCVSPDINAVAEKVRETVIRVQEYELRELERAYCLIYFTIAMDILKAVLSNNVELWKDSPASLAPEVQFTLGAYMEPQQSIYIWRADR